MRNLSGKFLGLVAMACFAGQAPAQLPIPDMPETPITVPGIQSATGDLIPSAGDATDRSLQRLMRARDLRIGRLAREHRAELDRDAAGELVVRAEVIAIDIGAEALDRALAHQFRLRRTHELVELGVKISVLQTPEGWSAKRGLKELRELDPAGSYDYNHVYLDGGSVDAGVAETAPARAAGARTARVGLVDAGVDGGHRVFEGMKIERFGCDGKIVPSIHGTAVAAILASHEAVGEIDAADVYCGSPTGGATDAVASALAWLAGQRVGVINISLVGPRNALLERVVTALVTRGFLIVAAVGNDGPAAPPLYPASYPGVVGVTAVDGGHHALIEACRGEQVDFAARGADMRAASQAPDAYAPVRGTSFAAPIVAALVAADLAAPDVATRERLLAKWTQSAHDLGKRGRDDVYGAGELGGFGSAVADQVNK